MGGKEDESTVHGVSVCAVSELNSAEYDAVVVVLTEGVPPPQALEDFVAAVRQTDKSLDKHVSVLSCPRVSGGRLVLSPTGPLTAYDDVRSMYEAALAGTRRAVEAGGARPVLALQPHPLWHNAELVALLGALEALYVPLQVRESFPAGRRAPDALGVYGEGTRAAVPRLLREAVALEAARGVARDIGGADPERMTPLRTASYLQDVFDGTDVSVRVVDDPEVLRKEYPLLAAVNRAAAVVERHRGCVIYLEYVPKSYERTVMFVGKGVTYDTGGCDIKAGGAMAGMSCDKSGAAAIAGFLQACALLRPELKVVAALGMVRNSVGEEAYVADELIASRSGLAVRVGNTDAEGRMVMADLLCEMGERAADEREPQLYTVATLTGHAHRAYGTGYTAALDNHAALGNSSALQAAGARLGDMVEVSTLRREDLAAHRGRAAGDDLHQAQNAASVATPRGHQAPAAFLLMAARLDRGGTRWTHLDVAASAGVLPDPPTAAPLLALAAHYGLVQLQQ